MGYRYDEFAPGEIYHVFTRSVEQRDVFLDSKDRERFLALLLHCMPAGPIKSFSMAQKMKQKSERAAEGEGLIDLLAFCIMNNHIHLLLKENKDGGITLYMQRLLNSYAKYFNMRRQRSGSLFINPFKAVLVDDDEYFLHVSRYIHLNPYVAHMVPDPLAYKWSSLREYIQPKLRPVYCHMARLSSFMPKKAYRLFVTDEADYARSLADIKHLLLDYE